MSKSRFNFVYLILFWDGFRYSAFGLLCYEQACCVGNVGIHTGDKFGPICRPTTHLEFNVIYLKWLQYRKETLAITHQHKRTKSTRAWQVIKINYEEISVIW